jgi:adenylate cyclase
MESPAFPERRRLAAILAIDMVAYSRQMRADEEGTLAALKAARQLSDPVIASAGGRIFKTMGDGLLCEFSSVVSAVSCAREMQRALATPGEDGPRFRIGVTLGDVVADGEDLYGDGVNMAVRLQSVAQPGGIAVSRVVRDQVGNRLPLRFVPRGKVALKNIPDPVEVFDVDDEGAGVRFRRPPAGRLAIAALVLIVVGAAGYTAWWLQGRTVTSASDPSTAAATASQSAPLVAVLPFANHSGDANQDYFSDGMTEDIIAALGRFRALAVLSSSAVLRFKTAPAPPDEVARRLGARYVVEGSIRRAGVRVRVQARLTDAQGGQVLWTDRFDGDTNDLFALQDELVQQIAGTLASRVGRVEQERVARKPAVNPTAYELVLRGRALVSKETRSALVEARGFFEQAMSITPDSADARVGLAQVFYAYVQYGYAASPNEALSDAEILIREALKSDPSNAAAYAMLARLLAYRERYDEALEVIARTLQLNPSDSDVQFARGTVLMWVGRTEEADHAFAIARRLDPFPTADHLFGIGLTDLLLGRKKRVRDELGAAVQQSSRDRAPLYALLAIANFQLGREEEAKAAAAMVRKQNPFFDGERFGTRLRDPHQREFLAEGLRQVGLRTN